MDVTPATLYLPARRWLDLVTDLLRESDDKDRADIEAIEHDSTKTESEKEDAMQEIYARHIDACHLRVATY